MAEAAEKAEAQVVEETEEAQDVAVVSSGTNQPDGIGRVDTAAKLVPGGMAVRSKEGVPVGRTVLTDHSVLLPLCRRALKNGRRAATILTLGHGSGTTKASASSNDLRCA